MPEQTFKTPQAPQEPQAPQAPEIDAETQALLTAQAATRAANSRQQTAAESMRQVRLTDLPQPAQGLARSQQVARAFRDARRNPFQPPARHRASPSNRQELDNCHPGRAEPAHRSDCRRRDPGTRTD